MKVAVHIGTHKTGSTTIQQFLTKNSDALAKMGICFPLFPGGPTGTAAHRPLTLWVLEGGEPPNFDVLTRDPPGQGMLISNETLCRVWSEEQIDRLAQMLPASSRIVCYYREPSRHIVSRYKQGVKSKAWRHATSLQDFVARETRAMRKPQGYYRFDAKADLWRSRFPDYRSLVYKENTNEGLARSFIENCGFALDSSPLVFSQSRNRSPSDESAFLLALLVAAVEDGTLSAAEFERLQPSIRNNDRAYAKAFAPHVRRDTVDLSAFIDAFAQANPVSAELLCVPADSRRTIEFAIGSDLSPPEAAGLALSVEAKVPPPGTTSGPLPTPGPERRVQRRGFFARA